jgi:hypothetical protein
MTGTPLSNWEGFESRVMAALPDGVHPSHLHVLATGLVVARNSDSKTLRPIGCPVCMGHRPSQDAAGNPVFPGGALLRAEEVSEIPSHLGPEIRANLWLCPGCRLPVVGLLPKFDTLGYRP